VYGIIMNSENELLLSDEFQLNMKMTKFPGGGLKFGEGSLDCLKREFREECSGQEIFNIQHFYTTDFYQKALFYNDAQLLSIYYTAELKKPIRFKISERPFDFKELENGSQSFRWKKPDEIEENEITFPIDRVVLKKLKQIY